MPAIASPADAAARSAAARSAAATDKAFDPSGGKEVAEIARRSDSGEPAGVIAPRREPDDSGTSLAMFFDPDPAPLTEPVWPAHVTRVHYGHRGDTPLPTVRPRKAKDPRSPAVGLVALLVFAFVATFFAWFSAGPLWLSLGHSHVGKATVADCPVAGINKRCGEFVASDNAFTAQVTLLGPTAEAASKGTTIRAEMVSKSSTIAYAGDPSSLYLRWISGLTIVLLCGFGIAWSTGAFRLGGRRARAVAFLASVGGPILITVGMLAVAWS
jgi:hypothetical protein